MTNPRYAPMYLYVPGHVQRCIVDINTTLDGLSMSHLINHRKRRVRKKWRRRITWLYGS